MFNQFGRGLIIFGALLAAIGGVLLIISKLGKLPKLPGDILWRKGSFTFYFPIVTCLIVSAVISIILYFLRR